MCKPSLDTEVVQAHLLGLLGRGGGNCTRCGGFVIPAARSLCTGCARMLSEEMYVLHARMIVRCLHGRENVCIQVLARVQYACILLAGNAIRERAHASNCAHVTTRMCNFRCEPPVN